MKKSINLYFNKTETTKCKLEKIKEVGFDEFFTGFCGNDEDLSVEEQCVFAKKLGLDCTMIHCRYFEPTMHFFWEKGTIGDQICEEYCDQIRRVKGLTRNFVVHLNASKEQKPSMYGVKRVKKILEVCDECNINLCVENLYSTKEFPYLLKHVNHERLKMCFDTGHKNFLTPNADFLKKFKDKIQVLHIHDNNGERDEHLICGEGTIDWESFASEISAITGIVLCAEIKVAGAFDVILKKTLESLNAIEDMANNRS